MLVVTSIFLFAVQEKTKKWRNVNKWILLNGEGELFLRERL